MERKEFEYSASIMFSLLGMALFGATAFWLTNEAITNDRGLILNNIIKFSESGATTFYWALAAFSVFFVLLALMGLFQRLKYGKQHLIVNTEFFQIPKTLFQKEKIVRYQDIKNIQRQSIKGTVTLMFTTSEGKATISNRTFKSNDEFKEAADMILSKCHNKAA